MNKDVIGGQNIHLAEGWWKTLWVSKLITKLLQMFSLCLFLHRETETNFFSIRTPRIDHKLYNVFFQKTQCVLFRTRFENSTGNYKRNLKWANHNVELATTCEKKSIWLLIDRNWMDVFHSNCYNEDTAISKSLYLQNVQRPQYCFMSGVGYWSQINDLP